MLNWKMGRWVAIAIAIVSALLLTGIADAVLGINLAYELLGFKLGMILGIANGISAWILYKVL